MAGVGAAARGNQRFVGVPRAWAAVVLAVLVYLALAVPFAAVQDVWVDESTQLLGSRLPLGRLFAWLAGAPEPLGVPPDRMPPLGYLVDWSWDHLAGTDPYGFRLLHLAIATAGVALVTALAARRHGLVPALVTGLLLAASPGLVTVGVEIRAYPLFVAATAVQLWLLYALCDGVTGPRLLAFAAAGLAATYIHFFGLVSTSALFVGLLAARARSLRGAGPTVLAWGATLVLALGIVPFIAGARAISHEPVPVATDFAGIYYYLPHIYGHAAMLLHPVLATILFIAFATLLVVAAGIAVVRVPPPAAAGPDVALVVALLAGAVVTVAAGFVAHGFDPMKASYSVWMVPVAALLAGAGCAGTALRARVAQGLALVTLAALLPISAGFAAHREWFVHGPEATLAGEVGVDPSRTAIVYVGPGWAYGYFPLVQRYDGRLAQFRLGEDGRLRWLRRGDAHPPVVPAAVLGRFARLLAVEISPRTGEDLRALADGVATDGFDPPPFALPGWHPAATTIRPGLYWLQLSRWERN